MVTTGMPQIHLPGMEKFQAYKTSLQDYCNKLKIPTPKYMAEKVDDGLIGTVSFGSNHVRCKVVSPSMKQADALAAYEALTQLGYLNGEPFVAEPNQLKRKDDNSMDTNSAKQIKPGAPCAITAKGHLNQICQKHKLGKPTYNTVTVPGEGAKNGFFSTVVVGTASFKGMAIHPKLKEAEQDAAQVALDAANLLLQNSATSVNNPNTNVAKPSVDKPPVNRKSQLQEYCQKNGISLPTYEIQHNETDKTFSAMVTVNGAQYVGLAHPAKKAAEASAAEIALKSLNLL